MFGLALNGAKRGEQFGVRLKKSSHLRNPAKSVVSNDSSHSGETIETASQKRNRRRRRPKKQVQLAQGTTYPKILSKKPHDAPMTKRDLYFCLRCGVVIVGKQAMDSAVGRVVLVNWENETVFDKFVKVPLHVADCRTSETGITERDLSSPDSITFDQARKEVGRLIKGKILIGHGLEVDLASLGLTHPWSDVRDTATYSAYMKEVSDSESRMLLPQELAFLSKNELGRDAGHGPICQAKVCLELYKMARGNWETELIQLVQQKEKQRQMVMSMRASGQGNSRIKGISVPLSAIRENDALFQHSYRQRGPSFLSASSVDSGSQSGAYYHDDEVTSETSYFSFDTDVLSSMSPTRSRKLSDFSASSQGRASVLSRQAQCNDDGPESYTTGDSASSLPQHQFRVPEEKLSYTVLNKPPRQFDVSGVDIWGVSRPLGCVTSPSQDSDFTNTSDVISEKLKCDQTFWSFNSNDQCGASISSNKEVRPYFSEEEELLRHLPSALIADLDEDFDSVLPVKNRMGDEESTDKCSVPWYRTRRRQKSVSDFGIRNVSGSDNLLSDSTRNASIDISNSNEPTEKKQSGFWFRSLRRHRVNSLPVQRFGKRSPFFDDGSVGSV